MTVPVADLDVYSCSCGRSPTGVCCGWHTLTEAEYQQRLAKLDNTDTRRSEYQDIVSTEDCVISALDMPDQPGC